jgi:SnoaL-like domain
MQPTVEEILGRNLHEVFNGLDAEMRRAAVRELWCRDCVFVDPEGIHRGTEAIQQSVAELRERFPGFVFSAVGRAQSIHGVGRLSWSFGPPEDPQRITGLDVGVTENGKLSALYTFVDPPLATDADT